MSNAIGIVLAAAIVVAGVLSGGVYGAVSSYRDAGAPLFIYNRLTGNVWYCHPTGCSPAAPTPAR